MLLVVSWAEVGGYSMLQPQIDHMVGKGIIHVSIRPEGSHHMTQNTDMCTAQHPLYDTQMPRHLNGSCAAHDVIASAMFTGAVHRYT